MAGEVSKFVTREMLCLSSVTSSVDPVGCSTDRLYQIWERRKINGGIRSRLMGGLLLKGIGRKFAGKA